MFLKNPNSYPSVQSLCEAWPSYLRCLLLSSIEIVPIWWSTTSPIIVWCCATMATCNYANALLDDPHNHHDTTMHMYHPTIPMIVVTRLCKYFHCITIGLQHIMTLMATSRCYRSDIATTIVVIVGSNFDVIVARYDTIAITYNQGRLIVAILSHPMLLSLHTHLLPMIGYATIKGHHQQ